MSIQTRGTKRSCGMCLTMCGLGLKRIGVRLGVPHPLVYRWRKEAGISGMIGPRMGHGVLKGSTRIQTAQRNAFNDEVLALARLEVETSWNRHPERMAIMREINWRNQHANATPETKLKRAVRVRTWKVCKAAGGYKAASTFDLAGCTYQALRDHLQSKFKRGMDWNNYGTKWEVDHIVPCNAFDLSREDEQRRCFHFTNLQPLEVSANRRKSWVMKRPEQVGFGI